MVCVSRIWPETQNLTFFLGEPKESDASTKCQRSIDPLDLELWPCFETAPDPGSGSESQFQFL